VGSVTSFKLATLEDIIPIRHQVLRKGRPIETASFIEDQLESTLHFGIYTEQNKIICCLTITPNIYKGIEAWQLRGMATHHDAQGKGIGSQLVKQSIEFVQHKENKALMWCNARESAVRFYEKLGWVIDSKRFDIEPIGPHFKMKVDLI